MTQSTRELLLRIAAEIKRKPEDVEPIIVTLEDNKLSTVESLRKLTKDQWRMLHIPKRLQLEIREKLALLPAAKEVEGGSASQGAGPKVEKAKELDVCGKQFANILTELSTEVEEFNEFKDCMGILQRIVKNIQEFPRDPSKRRLRPSQPIFSKLVGRYENARKWLFELGFRPAEEDLLFNEEPQTKQKLASALSAIDTIYLELDRMLAKQTTFAEAERALAERLKGIWRRELLVFLLPDNIALNIVIKRLNELYAPALKAPSTPSSGRSDKPGLSRTYIRIIFPGKHLAQAVFNATDTLDSIFGLVRNLLTTPDREFNLYTAPPKAYLQWTDEQLSKKGLVPHALVHFEWKDKGPDSGFAALLPEVLDVCSKPL